MPKPLVSCIMPTANRREFVLQSLEMFERQTYDRKELIILDDGEETVEDVAVGRPNVFYTMMGRRLSLGEKRNLACEMTRGELIVHWDDDDWQHPERLALQEAAMSAHREADVCGADQVLYYQVESGQARRYCYPTRLPAFVLGNTLCYRRTFWEKKKFPPLDLGEDSHFLRDPPAARVQVVEADLIVGILHGRNTAPKHLTHPVWQLVEAQACETLFGADRAFYDHFRKYC